MNPRLARWMYSAWVCFLAAGAVIASPPEPAPAPEAIELAIAPEAELARIVRERAELAARYDAAHPEVIKAAATETALRQAAATEDRSRFRRNFIHALSDELADAMQDRREIAARYGERGPETRIAQGVVLALTAAINAEVRTAG